MSGCRIRDHRRRGVSVCAPRALPEGVPADTQAAVGLAHAHRFIHIAPVVVGAVVGLGAGQWAMCRLLRLPLGFEDLALGAAGGGVGMTLLVSLVHLPLARQRTRLALHACLLVGRCPSCGYDLTTVSPDPDGCTVCPECGAAWRLLSKT